jgi:hypothetical protein
MVKDDRHRAIVRECTSADQNCQHVSTPKETPAMAFRGGTFELSSPMQLHPSNPSQVAVGHGNTLHGITRKTGRSSLMIRQWRREEKVKAGAV